jgi:hypothetical protein
MSVSTTKLRLGPLPKTESVKITFTCTAALKVKLDAMWPCTRMVHGEPVNAVTLIPCMLDAFIGRDRGFKRTTLHES